MTCHEYAPEGVCASRITFCLENGILRTLRLEDACDGHAQALARLVEGRSATEIIVLLRGIDCEGKGTSCPDQLTLALQEALNGRR